MRWLVIVVVIVVVAFFGYRYLYPDQSQQMAEQAEQATEQAAQKVEEAAGQAAEEVEKATDQAADTAQQAAESTEQAADQAADTAQQAAESASDKTAALTTEGVDLGQEVGTAVSDTINTLDGITDKASAEAALPDLESLKTKVDELGGKVDQLSDNGKEALASLLDDTLPELKDLVNKVEGMEGVGPVVKPTLDSIMTTLDGWAKKPA